MPVRKNAKRKIRRPKSCCSIYAKRKRASASALRRKNFQPFEDRSRPLVEKCFFCSNKSDEDDGAWVCLPCITKLELGVLPDNPLGLAVFGIQAGIDIWVDGNWFLTGILVDKYGRKPDRRWRW